MSASEQSNQSKQNNEDLIKGFNNPENSAKKALALVREVYKSPEEIAIFLHKNSKQLRQTKIGEIIGATGEENKALLDKFTEQTEVGDKGFIKAMRAYMKTFVMSGEAQSVDKVMESFAKHYKINGQEKDNFRTQDAAYILAFSTMMVATDLASPSVKKKMTLDQFIANNKGINDNRDFPKKMLEDIYNSLKAEPFDPSRKSQEMGITQQPIKTKKSPVTQASSVRKTLTDDPKHDATAPTKPFVLPKAFGNPNFAPANADAPSKNKPNMMNKIKDKIKDTIKKSALEAVRGISSLMPSPTKRGYSEFNNPVETKTKQPIQQVTKNNSR